MRIIHQVQYILLGLATFFFTACSQEEIEQTKEVKQSELRVMVNHPDAAATRASINGIETTFETGDQIGFFAVTTGGDYNYPVYYNIPLTFDGTEWKPSDDNIKLFHSPNYTYYAYYPYKENPEGWISEDADTGEEFFEEIINQWEPKLDQSTLEDYLASDLMVAKGVATTNDDNSGTVSFTLEHQMGLLEFQLRGESGAPIDTGNMDSKKYFNHYQNVDGKENYYPVPYNDGVVFRYIGKPATGYSFMYQTAQTVQNGIATVLHTVGDKGKIKIDNIDGIQLYNGYN